MADAQGYTDELTTWYKSPPPIARRRRREILKDTLSWINIDSTSALRPNDTGRATEDHKLEYDVTRYLRPVLPFVVDENDLLPGTGMQSYDTFCLHCGNTLQQSGISHLQSDGSCPFTCSHCNTRDHQGQLCPRLWLSQHFQTRHGLYMCVQPYLKVRPSLEDLRVIFRDYPQYRAFVASVPPIGGVETIECIDETEYTNETEPETGQAPEEPSQS